MRQCFHKPSNQVALRFHSLVVLTVLSSGTPNFPLRMWPISKRSYLCICGVEQASTTTSSMKASVTRLALVQHALSGGRVRRVYVGLITLIRISVLYARNADHCKVAQDGFIIEAEFDSNIQTSALFLAVLGSSFSAMILSTSIRRSGSSRPGSTRRRWSKSLVSWFRR